jgi:hypothetical protein
VVNWKRTERPGRPEDDGQMQSLSPCLAPHASMQSASREVSELELGKI